jgi:hypothetical protein
VPWSSNIRVRLPIAILQKTSFPELLSPREVERVRRSSSVLVVDQHEQQQQQQYAPPVRASSPAPAVHYTPAPLKAAEAIYTPAPSMPRTQQNAQKAPGSPVITTTAAAEQKPPSGPIVALQHNYAAGGLAPPRSPVVGAPAPAPAAHHEYGLAPPHSPVIGGSKSPRRSSGSGFGALVESHDGSASLDVPKEAHDAASKPFLGYVAEEDIAAYKRAETYFQHWDRDGNGGIDRNEFKALHADLVKNDITALSLADAWANLDADGDGTITFNEYVDFLIGVGSLRPPPDETASRPRRDSFVFEVEAYPYVMTSEDTNFSARGLCQK